ncbi:hypothetical protein Aeqsu_3170 [Aequorivita sublithincola DSM 14238]|uniref:Uncharacterized protein n=1 Tax=Aequorivita sublithincola (strain DSM 14238 / LMG 21431 / ACAM 643 / 9-3) TaxID=746697 RepID=I3Z036_AEQSU|nr:hypothetical protein [Aequorivita sublithincola]AFL82604.1 hypothetical protein Aeqsu_3170 [Aequorivita sublithincola DSM 14238]
MENLELINIWKEQNAKIEKTLAINKLLLKETISRKAESSLQGLVRLTTAGIIAFVIYLLILGYVLVYAISNYSSASNYFIISMSAIALINLKGFADYIKHLVWTKNINYNGSVLKIQKQLSKLQLSIINHSKIMILQCPFWTTFYLSNSWFPQDVGVPYILFQITITGSFIYLTYWLYKQHSPENFNKKWFRNMIAGSGGKSVEKAIEFYKEIEEFEKE